MKNSCPNKNLPEWKLLVHQVGEVEAYRAFLAHKESIPPVKSELELRRAVKLTGSRFSNEQRIGILKRLRMYNKKHGTSHSITFEDINPSFYKARFHINYLPVNLRKQQARDSKRSEEDRSFYNMYPASTYRYEGEMPYITPSLRHNETEETLGFFNEEGDFLPYVSRPGNDEVIYREFYEPVDSADFVDGRDFDGDIYEDTIGDGFIQTQKVNPRYQELINLRKIERRDLYNSSARLRQEARKKGVSAVEKTAIMGEVFKKIARIAEIETELVELVNTHNLTAAKKFFEADMAKLDKMFAGDITKISDDDLRWAIYTVNLWRRASDFSEDGQNLFWTAAEVQTTNKNSTNYDERLDTLRTEYVNFSDRANRHRNEHIQAALDARVRAAGKAIFDGNFTWEKSRLYKDISRLSAEALDISHIDHELTQLMYRLGKDANEGANMRSQEIMDEINDMMKETGIKDFSWIQQTFSNTDNRITGNMVVRYTQSYYDTVKDWADSRRRAIDSINHTTFDDKIKASQIQSVNRTYFNRLKSISILVDVRKLFPSDLSAEKFTEQEIQEHKDLLLRTLGQREYDIVMAEMEEKLRKFEEDRRGMHNYYHNVMFTKAQAGEARLAYDYWVTNNSPYKEADLFYGVSSDNKVIDRSSPTHDYSITIAKRFDKDGKDLGFYDEKYERIRSDKNKARVYDYMMKLMAELRQYIPAEKANILQVNSIPTIYKSMIEEYQMSGIAAGFAPILDKMKGAIKADEFSEDSSVHVDVLSGKLDYRQQAKYIVNSKPEIDDYVTRKQLAYKAMHDVNPSLEQMNEWKKEAIYNIAMRKSYDLPAVMQMFAIMAYGYKHKSKVDMTMQAAAMLVLQSAQEPKVKSRTQDEKALAKSEKLNNMTLAVNNFMNHFYGYREREQRTDDKLKTSKLATAEEKKVREEIEYAFAKIEESWKAGKMSAKEYQAAISELEKQYDKTLGRVSGAKVIDQVLKYYQLVNLGWNPWSATSNLGFGFISNFTQAADGRNFTQQDMVRAYSIVMNNVLFAGKLTQTGQKVTSLANRLDIMKEARYEVMGKTAANTVSRKSARYVKNVASGFKMQSSTEFMNQTPIMLSLMFNEKITDKDGNVSDLWDAMNEQGRLRDIFRTEENIKDWEDPDNAQKLKNLKAKIDEWIQFAHGNYDHINSPILASSHILGKVLIMFRRWALMGFYERFGGEKTYFTTGITRKGRYKSYDAVTLSTALATVGTLLLPIPVVGTAVGAGIGAIAGYFNTRLNGDVRGDMTIGEEAGMTLKYLLMSSPVISQVMNAAGIDKPSFENQGYSPVNAANLRKNLAEIHILNGLTILGMLLHYAIKGLDDDEKDSYKSQSLFFLLNQMTRMNTDIQFFINPSQFRQINKNIIPLFTLWDDLSKTWEAVVKTLAGDAYMKSGPFEGRNRIFVRGARLVPFGKSWIRMTGSTGQMLRPDQYETDFIDNFWSTLLNEDEEDQ